MIRPFVLQARLKRILLLDGTAGPVILVLVNRELTDIALMYYDVYK